VAVVEQASDNPDLVGRRVVADINIGCGQCPSCLKGDPRHCPDRRVIGIKGHQGAFAERVAVPAANLHLVPDGVSDEEAVFAEPLAAALEIAQQVHLKADMKMAVAGDGKLGLLIALALRHQVPGLLLIGRHPEKLALAQAQGVAVCLAGSDQARAAQGSCDLVVEATGRPQGLEQALALVRPEGTVALKTTSHLPVELDMSRVVVNEITLIGSRCGDLALALHFLDRHLLDVKPLVQAVFPLEQFAAAMDHAQRPGALKVLIRL
jgi:threonine dehydrogenase-like Zn-dependent dehydrogenase